MKESREHSEIQRSVYAVIDRNRNTRQKTVLLSYVAGITRQQSETLREEKVRAGEVLQDTRARVRAELESQPAQLPKPGQRKPVQSVRSIPSA